MASGVRLRPPDCKNEIPVERRRPGCRRGRDEDPKSGFFAVSSGVVTGFAIRITRQAVLRLALYPSPASLRHIRTWHGTSNSRAAGPRFLQPCTRPSRGPHRSLAVASPLPRRSTLLKKQGTTARQRWGSGEAPVAPRMYERTVGNTVPPIPPKTAKNPTSCRSLSFHNDLHRTQKQRAAHSPNVPRLSTTGLPA